MYRGKISGFTLGSLIFTIGLWFCNPRNDDQVATYSILKQFEEEVKESISKRSSVDDLISHDIVLDTFSIYELEVNNYQLAFAQYHSADNKLDISIIGIENFSGSLAPTYLLIDRQSKEYFIDSLKVKSDSLHIYCKALVASRQEAFKISFDLKFNGKSFPWSVNTGEESIEPINTIDVIAPLKEI